MREGQPDLATGCTERYISVPLPATPADRRSVKEECMANQGFRGHGHPNLLLVNDFGNPPVRSFKAETEVPLTPEQFEQMQTWLKDPEANKKKIVDFLHEQVAGAGSKPKDRDKANKMFDAALGVLPQTA
jgi:hypothetical protein